MKSFPRLPQSRESLAASLVFTKTERDEAFSRIHILRDEIDRMRAQINRRSLLIVLLAVVLVIVAGSYWSHYQNVQH